MSQPDPVTRDGCEASLTRAGLAYTQIDDDPWASYCQSPALQTLVGEEMALGRVPVWADAIVRRMIGSPLPGTWMAPVAMPSDEML